MSGLRKLRMILLLVFGVPSLLCVGGVAVWETLFGEVTVAVLGPATVWIDGELAATVTDYEALQVELPQGAHTLKIQTELGAAELSADLDSAWDSWLLPSPGQCFLQLDVTDTYYGYGESEDPFIKARHGDGALIELPANWAFFEDDLPESISEHAQAYLIIDLPCDRIQDSDADLLAEMGI